MASQKVAIVTGSNKGIGYAIVKGLCEKYEGLVYVTARNVERGEKAVKSLKDLGFNPSFHQLDVNDQDSVDKFRDYIKTTHGGIDVLVNNAAIAFDNDAKEPVSEQAEKTLSTNYFSLVRVCDALFPLLRENAQVVNVSSSAGHLSRIPSTDLKKKFSDPSLTVEQLDDLMKQFISDTKNGSHGEKGWGNSTYVVSKVGVSALTRIQQRMFNAESPQRNVSCNSVHPGYVDTDMTNHKGLLTIEEGAKAPLFLALGQHQLKGQYIWLNTDVVDWLALDTPAKY
ncbi:PREDICTED: carbonyl reductase [NADPH] 3-like [Nicrophorus vespilloides]|uniref:carbonyl reductase (NADPH) n=1 Tax=Nicrophorus vespilloides TaxID=110193 RepID=A0ABM1N2Q5_NICVS|nr:PREDICTED: carbonyl reductase [NADPH] 3-like [Nicrophorus vespilloides]